ncbi:adenylate/guanylate cyclase domain-containing protein [Bradyrhizobium guangdongense]|uniref:adenylate/guanylate cyclase domain-containing protein n=1 Tax=Bradyrhizobium guangdongense TaxID=1325090 RepID=UPI0024BFC42D|nr:adenylate/guanylate cyclase domain-containing protein [Bradyrhizobium guangdongense]
MLCPACQTETLPDDRVCRSCGVSFALVCPNCQQPNLDAARFCGACGERLHQQAPVGERKVVTVLFADIVGSTEMIGAGDPELALDRLPPALARMGEAIQQFQGTITRSMGDALLAIFGMPQAQEDHALRACQAALAMIQSSHANGITLRVGIHAGEIVAGLPDKFTKEQSVYGPAVHLASRLEHMAQPGEICITESTFRLVHAACEARSMGHQDVKGFPRPIVVYRLLGLKQAGAAFPEALAGVYRGREKELAILHEAFAGAERGVGRAIGISAAPGLGKSRLCFEFSRAVRDRLVPVLDARASPYDHSGPLQPLVEFFRTFFRIVPADDAGTAREKIASRIEAAVPHLKDDVPLLCDFLGISADKSPVDPKARRGRLVNLVCSLVRDGTRTPSIIVIEDIHWLDEASIEFVSALVDVVAQSRVLLILTYRPTYQAPWQEGPNFHEIRLDELSDGDVASLAVDLMGDHPSTRAVRQRIIERSGGNPFFAEELIRSLVDSGELGGHAGHYEAAQEPAMEVLPATVQSVIAARIDRLLPRDKEVLQVGATIGREFPLAVLAEVTAAPAADLAPILDRLSQLELVQPGDQGAPDRFAFRHPLIQEVAYATQLRSRRVELHAAVAKALEAFHHKQLGEYADLISYHFEAARDFLPAATYAARAAAWIGTLHSMVALKSWKRVRLLLQAVPRSAETDRLRVRASGQIVGMGWREGTSAEEVSPFAKEALELAREAKDAVSEVLILAVYGRVLACTGSADDYVKQVLQAIDLTNARDPSLNTMLQIFLCQAYGYAGKLREALQASDTALADITNILPAHEALIGFNVKRWVESLRARVLVRMGDFAVARQSIADLIATESEFPDPAVQFIPHLAGVELAWLLGDVERAEFHSRCIEKVGAASGLPYLAVYSAACAALALSLAGDHVGAIQKLEATVRLAREAYAGLEYESEMLAFLAELYLRSNSPAAAVSAAERSLSVAVERGARLAECRSLIFLGQALEAGKLRHPQHDAAALFARARRLIDETGAKAYEPLLSAREACVGSEPEA